MAITGFPNSAGGGCQPDYPRILGYTGPGDTGTFSGDSGSGAFEYTLTNSMPLTSSFQGLYFTGGSGFFTGPFHEGGYTSGGDYVAEYIAAFSGTYSGTLADSNSPAYGPYSITATLSQNSSYALSLTYTDSGGTHILTGAVIGGRTTFATGFDGNPMTLVYDCIPYVTCSMPGFYAYDSINRYVGKLQ